MEKHFRTLGILMISYAVLKIVLFTIGLQFLAIGMQYIIDDPEAMFAVHLAKYIIGTMIFLYAIPAVIAGIGLLNRKEWALILALIVGVISLPVFPLGTALGVYAIIVFLMKHSRTYNPPGTDTKQEGS